MPRLKFSILLFGTALVLLAASCASPAAQATNPPSNPVPVTAATVTARPTNPADPAATSPAPAAQPTAASQTSGAAPASGGVTYTIDASKSQARYRVREQLANRDLPSDAVGATNAVSGSIIVKPEGSIDPASKITVDLTNLQTDQAMRDNFVRRNVLQTSQYPTATFVPTAVSGLPSPLPENGPVKFQITGDLTIHGTTRPVTWDVTGNIQNGVASGTATTSFKFEDFNLNQPRVPVVLSVEDHITLEVDVTVKK